MTLAPDSPAAAIIGAGMMGAWHARAAAKAGARVVAVIDSDAKAAASLSARIPGSVGASGLEKLQALSVSVAHVCTPVHTHAATVASLLDAGVHVLVEKPLAPSLAETRSLLERAASAGRLVVPVHQFGFQRGVVHALKQLPGLGPVLHFDFILCTAGARAESDRPGLVDSVLPHPLSLVPLFLRDTSASLQWRALRPRPGELRAMSASGEATISILLSTGGRPTCNQLTLVCERGTVSMDLFHGFSVVEAGHVSRLRKISRPITRSATTVVSAAGNLFMRTVRRQTGFPGLDELVSTFYEAVAGVAPSPIPAAQVLWVAEARDAILSAGAA